jgi:hypothetical protein
MKNRSDVARLKLKTGIRDKPQISQITRIWLGDGKRSLGDRSGRGMDSTARQCSLLDR